MKKIKLTRKAKRQLAAIMVMAVLGVLMLVLGIVAVVAGMVVVLGDGWASGLAVLVAGIMFGGAIGLGELVRCLANVHFR